MFLITFLSLVIVIIIAITSVFVVSRIFGEGKLTFIIPIVFAFTSYILLAARTIIFGRNGTFAEVFMGNYLFLFINLSTAIFILCVSYIISNFFGFDILKYLSNHKIIFCFSLLFFISFLMVFQYLNFNNIEINHMKIKINKLNSSLLSKKLKIGFISDIHLNKVFDGRYFDSALQKFSEENVDIVIIGGDFIDNKPSWIEDDIKFIINKYNNNFKYGINLVLGNHEYYGGIKENIKFIKELGINILRDEVLDVQGIKIIGRDYYRTKKEKKPLAEIMIENKIKTEDIKIVVEHSPKSIKENTENNVDLQLLGHTHAGQIFPINLITKIIFKNSYGLKNFGDNTYTYVSSGLGSWMIPYRIRKREIVIIDLEF
ncbi:MAG: metallophosphoesterase [Fusobacteriaceae bacterium]